MINIDRKGIYTIFILMGCAALVGCFLVFAYLILFEVDIHIENYTGFGKILIMGMLCYIVGIIGFAIADLGENEVE